MHFFIFVNNEWLLRVSSFIRQECLQIFFFLSFCDLQLPASSQRSKEVKEFTLIFRDCFISYCLYFLMTFVLSIVRHSFECLYIRKGKSLLHPLTIHVVYFTPNYKTGFFTSLNFLKSVK
jgi:hypothetical protein